MVSFTCNHCQDVVKKPKVQGHAGTCGSHSFTCVDCMQVFDLDSIRAHTSCVTEEDKYQGKWKQKLSNNNSNSKAGNGEPPRGIERPPRAPMNDLSSSEDSDDDWAGKAAAVTKKRATPTAATKTPAGRKNPRPGVSPSSDDEGEGDMKHHETVTAAPPAKKPKTARSASATPQVRPAKAEEEEAGGAVHPGKKDTPLLLPRSTISTDCVVPSFVLGTSQEVADIVRDVLSEQGVASMRTKEMSAALVERYAKRIAKSVRHAVDTAVELGALKVDAKGNVSPA